MCPEAEPGLSQRISGADRAGLIGLVSDLVSRFTERDALQCLRHPFSSPQVVETIVSSRTLFAFASVRKAVALHPGAPRVEALRCLDDLGWRDLADIGRETRTPVPVRRAANLKIVERLGRLSSGERMALARLADRDLLKRLLADPDSRVFLSALRNPRLAEDDLLAFATTGSPLPAHLALLAADEVWSSRKQVRRALLRSKGTPRSAAISLLPFAGKDELKELTDDPAVERFLAACARRLLEEGIAFVDRPRRRS